MNYSHDHSGNVAVRAVSAILAPQIAGQPVKQVAELGNTVTFSVVVADARAVTFQWQFNGTDIPGATGDSLLLTSVNTANEGQYSVVVTNSAGSVTSAPAALLLDSDGDGLPDSWEIANFGNTSSQRSAGDPDGDGISNLDEFLDSTNPASAASFRPRLIAYSDAGGSVTVTPMKLSYDLGETVTLTAVSFAPGVFAGWTGDLIGATNPVTVTLNGNKTIRARFAAAVPIPPGIVAFWRAETDANDLIGGHHGAFFSGATAIAPRVSALGKVGGAFTFDGTVHIQVPESAALKPAQVTLEAWVFPTVLSGDHQTVIACGSSTNGNDTWYLGVFNGYPRFWSHGNDLMEGSSTIPLNEWTHLAATFDGATKWLYVNGVAKARQGAQRALVYDAVPVTIGADWASNAPAALFNGRIDEVAIYDRALTAYEIADIYKAGFMGKNAGQPYFTAPSQLSNMVLGAGFTQQLTTILGAAPVSFSLSAGALPPGMILSSTGLVSGAPGAPGIFDFTVQATDAAGESTERLFVLRVLQPVVPPAGLVAWWRGEPAAGGVVSDIIGGHDGSFFSGAAAAAPAHTVDGKVGSAFVFNGTLYVRVPDAIDLRPPAVTLEAWIFPTLLNHDDDQTVIARGSSTNSDDAWQLCVSSGGPRFWSHGRLNLDGPSPIPLHEWTHLAATFDGTTKRLYVNGVEAAWQGGLGALAYDAAPVPVTIGADWSNNAPGALFHGRIDEVSFYRRALSAAEIFSLADAGAAGKSTAGL